jgi:hypothetical protein
MSDKHRQEALNASTLFALLHATWNNPKELGQKIYYIVGGSGIGKTQIPKQVAAELGYDFHEMFPAQKESVDFGGYPNPSTMEVGKGKKAETVDVMDLIPTRDLAVLKYATKWTVVMMDEMDKCELPVHNVLSQLFESRKINGEPISPFIIFVATGNRLEDKAGGRPLPNQLKRRMCIIEITGYFSQLAPQELFSNEVAARDLVNESNPRSVVKLGESLKGGLLFENFNEDGERETPYALSVAAGEVGKTVAMNFLKWMQIRKNAVSIKEVLLNPAKAPLPKNIDLTYMLIGGLVHTLKSRPAAIVQIVPYVQRLNKEMQAMFARFASAEAGEINQYAEFSEFFIELDAFQA